MGRLVFSRRVQKAPRGGRGRPTARSLQVLGSQFEGVMRADVKGALATFATRVDYDKVSDAVYSGDWRKVFATMPLDDVAPLMTDAMDGSGRAMVQASEIEGDKFATMQLPGGGTPRPDSLSVGIKNPRVRAYVSTRTGALIQNVTDDLQNNVQVAVAAGISGNLSPREVATIIRDGLPLNNRQQASLARYKAGLAQTDLSLERQASLTDRMRNALTDERATTIARTESQYAINAGQRATWDEAVEQGLIDDNSVKTWTCEAEPCRFCEQLEGMQVALNEPFVVPSSGEAVDMPPLHVSCRCSCSLDPKGDL